jgi:hypothetical protein
MLNTPKETQKGPNRESNAGPRPVLETWLDSRIEEPEGRIIPLNHRG